MNKRVLVPRLGIWVAPMVFDPCFESREASRFNIAVDDPE